MIRAVVIDEETLALKNTVNLLQSFKQLEIINTFTSPYEALLQILDIIPDVVFLETEMIELNGMKMADIIKLKCPHIQVVFITKSEKYAIKAYELNVLDYLIKPLKHERFYMTLKRLERKLILPKPNFDKTICSFGELCFRDSNHSIITNIRWRTKKTEELFAYLLHNKNKSIHTNSLVDLLWPHVDSKQGITLLYSAVYQIRKTMKKIDFDVEVISKDNTYMLKLNNVHHDLLDWELAVDKLPKLNLNTLHEHLQTIKMYKGDYLDKNNYPWSEEERKVLNDVWWHHVGKVSDYLVLQDKVMEAIRLLNHIREVSSDYEKVYLSLMELYALINDGTQVQDLYQNLNSMLLKELGVSPAQETIDWYNNWMKNVSPMINKS